MKIIKKTIMLLGILCVILLCIIFFLLARKKKNDFDVSLYTKLFTYISYSKKYSLLNECPGAEIEDGEWEKTIDTMNIYLQKIMSQNDYSTYSDHIHVFSDSEEEIVNDILNSVEKYNNEEKKFVISLLECVSLQELLEQRLNRYFSFDKILHYPIFPLKGDTIDFGGEYQASVPFCCFNSEYQPILILDNDTINISGVRNVFSEKATKKGNIKREGYITVNQRGKIITIPVKVEYYVK
jgi:hypothetical protein